MNPVRSIVLAVACVVTISTPLFAQQGAAQNPPNAPKVPVPGLTIEPDNAKMPPVSKFTNGTDQEIAIEYGKEKFRLKPGASKDVPTPQQKTFELKIYEFAGKDGLRRRYQGGATPNDPKRTIPLDWAMPKKGKVI